MAGAGAARGRVWHGVWVAVYAFMNYVVIRCRRFAHRPKPMWELMGGLIGHNLSGGAADSG